MLVFFLIRNSEYCLRVRVRACVRMCACVDWVELTSHGVLFVVCVSKNHMSVYVNRIHMFAICVNISCNLNKSIEHE